MRAVSILSEMSGQNYKGCKWPWQESLTSWLLLYHSCLTSCSVLIMNIMSNRHIYQLRTFVQMFEKKKIKLHSIWCEPQDYQEEDTHKPLSRLDSFWPSYGLRSISECSKTEPEAPVWSKVHQGAITPLPLYALSDVEGTLNKILDSGNLLWIMRNKIRSFLPNSSINTCFQKSTHFHTLFGKSPEMSLVIKEKRFLCNHESWLERIFSPLQPWLTVAKQTM